MAAGSAVIFLEEHESNTFFEKSVAKQVLNLGSNVLTPSDTFWMMCSLLFWNSSSNLLSQIKVVLGLSKCLKADMGSVIANAKDTWLTNPNHALTPEMSVGVGNPRIAPRIFGQGLMQSIPTVNPANSTSI